MDKIFDFLYAYGSSLKREWKFHIVSTIIICFLILGLSEINSLLSLLASFALVYFAKRQSEIVEKQKKISEYQAEMQRCSVIYDSFMRIRQEKFIELKRLYTDFYSYCFFFLNVLFPCAFGLKNPMNGQNCFIDMNNINDADIITSYYTEMKLDFIDDFFKKSTEASQKLKTFINENDVFLEKNNQLIEDLKIVSRDFYEFFYTVSNDINFQNSFITISKKLIKNSLANLHTNQADKSEIVKFRIFFYTFMWGRLMFTYGDVRNNMLYFYPNSPFKGQTYTADNVSKWSKTEKTAFATFVIMHDFFEKWKKQIDNIFLSSFEKVRKVVENENQSENP